jgi:hypothetical protein
LSHPLSSDIKKRNKKGGALQLRLFHINSIIFAQFVALDTLEA